MDNNLQQPNNKNGNANQERRVFGGRKFGGRGGRPGHRGQDFVKPEYEQKVLDIARVARVTKGGKRFSFRATVVIGDMKGKVGVGMAKGKDVAQSVQKAYNQAKKRMVNVVTVSGTIPYQVEAKYNSAVVILKPSRGGVKAGGPVRVVAKLSGINSLTGKLTERTNNKVNIAMATIRALEKIRSRKIQNK
jgi:small subunit ribosomal protein S5